MSGIPEPSPNLEGPLDGAGLNFSLENPLDGAGLNFSLQDPLDSAGHNLDRTGALEDTVVSIFLVQHLIKPLGCFRVNRWEML